MKKNKLNIMIVMIGILVVASACGNVTEEKQLETA